VATDIGTKAVQRCLADAGIGKQEVDGLIITTCTGYLCPGLSSYVCESLGFRDNIFTSDLVGHGCGAAIPALQVADQFLKSGRGSNVLVLCVEVCSAAFFWGSDIGLILSNSIFADGAAACLLTTDSRRSGLEIRAFESLLWPQYREDLRFKQQDSRLCNVINKKRARDRRGRGKGIVRQTVFHREKALSALRHSSGRADHPRSRGIRASSHPGRRVTVEKYLARIRQHVVPHGLVCPKGDTQPAAAQP